MSETRDAEGTKTDVLEELRNGALAALKRARKQAEFTAFQTDTDLIQSVEGKPVRVKPSKPPERS